MRMVICVECNQEKPHHAKGLCRACYDRRWKQANPEKVAAQGRRYREGHREELVVRVCRWQKENPDKMAAKRRRWREKHPERDAANSCHYYQEHREECLARRCRWRKENPEKKATINARRQARKQGLPDTLTTEQAEQLLAIGRAVYPGEKLHLDHFIPLTAGGGTTLANCHYIPASLNGSKNDKLPQEVYGQLELV